MAISIVTNVSSLSAQRNLNRTQNNLTQSMGRLSSGLRINRAGDDAAGLAISEKLKSQIRSMSQAERNAMDGISMLQVAEGAMNETTGVLTRMRELAIQSATDTNSDTERSFIDLEFQQLVSEIDRIANVTEFNGTQLVDGSASSVDFQIGIQNDPNDRINIGIDDMRTSALGGGMGSLALTSKAGAQGALDTIDAAIEDVSTARAEIGSKQNRLQVAIGNLGVWRENLAAANSRIRDVDVAEEAAQLTRSNILMQAGTSVLAQANQSPSIALSLLG